MVFLRSGDAARGAVITGAASGIGLAVAERCAQRGMHVAIADVAAPAALAAAAARVTAAAAGRGRVVAVHADVRLAADNDRLRDRAYAEFGDVGFLFLNAGVSAHSPGSERETSAFRIPVRDWEGTFGVNVYGVLHGLRAFVPRMIAQGTEAAVVCTSSYAGLMNSSQIGFGSHLPYTASKHVVTLVGEALQHELRSTAGCRVRAHVLHPAGVDTGFARNAAEATVAASEIADEGARRAKVEELQERTGMKALRRGLPPAGIADLLEAGVGDGRFYILAHDKEPKEFFKELIRTRMEDILLERPPLSHMIRGPAGQEQRARIRARRAPRQKSGKL